MEDEINFIIRCRKEVRKFFRSQQVRRHIKTRVNKKWAKRYGYKIDMTEFMDLFYD